MEMELFSRSFYNCVLLLSVVTLMISLLPNHNTLFFHRLPYATIFGGVGAFTKDHYDMINGMSNLFWGWGGEDDDLYQRYI